MSEAYDYDPAGWKGHDFGAARAAYDRHVGSSYADAKAKALPDASLVEPTVTSKAQRPLIVVVDQTGSMGQWPATMFSKLPYLDHEVRWYLGDDAEVCFAAIGDATTGERYPLQIRPFDTGKGLEQRLKELVIVRGGGGGMHESYELAALYFLHNLDVDPAAQPIIIFIGDEKAYPNISSNDAKNICGVTLQKSVTTSSVFAELRDRASVYFIHKPYSSRRTDGDKLDPDSRAVRKQWTDLVGGEDHVAPLADPSRVVDVIFGILAGEVDRVADFRKEIEDRQEPDQVAIVYKSLATVHALPAPRKQLEAGKDGASRIFTDSDADDAPPLFGV